MSSWAYCNYPRLFFDHAHNDYVELATDTGLAGFLPALGLALIFFLSLLRGWRDKRSRFGKCIGAGGLYSCVVVAVHSGTDFNMHIPANALLTAVIAGLTHAAIFSHHESSEPQAAATAAASRGRSSKRLLFALGALPLACLALYLLSGKKAEALEQARALARLDDSYVIPESASKTLMIQRRTKGYLLRLSSSYLFQALEIAWRATGDIGQVKSITPANDDARAVLDLFLEWRGFEG